MIKNMQIIELIETLFDETRNVVNQRLDTLERQVNLVLTMPQTTNTCCSPTSTSEVSNDLEYVKHFNSLSQKLAGISNFLDQMNYRLKQLEEHNVNLNQNQKTQTHLRTPILGPQHLEGLVMVPEIKVSKKDESDLDTKNIVIQPNFVFPISDSDSVNKELVEENEVVEAEEVVEEEEEQQEEEVVEEEVVEEEVVEEEVAEEEVAEEEEQQEEEVVEEEEQQEDEPLELEEFIYTSKNKTTKYFKDQYNKVYRQIDEETPEDEPFAEYDEKTKKLTRLPN